MSLKCEQRGDMPCVDHPQPRLSWALASERRDERQTAYRILVAEHADDLAAERGTLWDSGRVASAESLLVPYAGRPLPAAAEMVWTVRVWDRDGEPSDWSTPARLRTGPEAWRAEWIRRDDAYDPGVEAPTDTNRGEERKLMVDPAPYLRRTFAVDGPVRRAVLYATARGVVELSLNGSRVGDAVLTPGWTDFRTRIEYAAHDVTGLLREGENALGAILGDGWYAGYIGSDNKRRAAHYGRVPELLCELHVEHGDGGRTIVASDGSWYATTGPIRYSDLLMGERYDARDELGAWAEPGYDATGWHPVLARPRDEVALVPERAQPIRVTEEIRPVAVTERAPGVHVFDLGQNMVGWVRLRVQGERGHVVQLRFAEMLEPDGSLHLANLRSARPLETYILKGEGVEEHEPRFTFHGFRYVEVTGLSGDGAGLEAITGRVVHNDMPRTGSFACSSELVNQLWRNIDWGQRGNFLSVPTDCPQRDERLGWLADAQVFAPTASLNMDVAAFMTKWGDDVLDAQSADGGYPDVAPRLVTEKNGAPAWADAGVIVPWVVYARYGDRRLLERHWDAMERYMAYLARHNPDLLWTQRRYKDYGDWLSVGADTPKDVVATAYWAYDAALMARMATALDRPERAAHYERLRRGITDAFNRAFVRDDAYVEGDTQTAYLLALAFDLLPEALRARAAERLVADIERHGGHLTTGFLGVGLLCPVLSATGHSDVAHRLLLNETFPSWGYSIRHGATTIWERWDGWTEHAGFQTANMNSFNHYSLGSVGQWLYEHVAGIRAAEPGYRHVVIAPEPGELDHAEATYVSVRGPITSAWRRSGDTLLLQVEIPANVTATVLLPARPAAEDEDGVRAVRRDGDHWAVDVGSGRYRFSAALAADRATA